MIPKKYVDTLRKYTKSQKIKVVNSSVDGHGAWVSEERLVRIDFKQPRRIVVSAWLHELGHAVDEGLMTQTQAKKISKAYTAVYRSRHTSQQAKTVVESEIRAWFYGQQIAESLKFKLGTWFYEQKKLCIKNYEDHMRRTGA